MLKKTKEYCHVSGRLFERRDFMKGFEQGENGTPKFAKCIHMQLMAE